MPRRSITTEAWIDDRFADLPALTKLAFIRLITGPEVNACGAIHLTRRAAAKIAPDLPATPDEFEAVVLELADAELVRTYPEDWLYIPAWIRHQVAGAGMMQAARRAAATLPESLRRQATRDLDKTQETSHRRDVHEQEHPSHPAQSHDGHTKDTTRTRKPAHTRKKPEPPPQPPPHTDPEPPQSLPGGTHTVVVAGGDFPLRGEVSPQQDQETEGAAPTTAEQAAAAAAREAMATALRATRIPPTTTPRDTTDNPQERRARLAAQLNTTPTDTLQDHGR